MAAFRDCAADEGKDRQAKHERDGYFHKKSGGKPLLDSADCVIIGYVVVMDLKNKSNNDIRL